MEINAIYVKKTKEILYSRSGHDFRRSEDGKCFVDGGFNYFRWGGVAENVILIQLDSDKLLKQIIYYDFLYKNNNAEDFKEGYYGRFQLREGSSKEFYKELIVKGFKKVWKHHMKESVK